MTTGADHPRRARAGPAWLANWLERHQHPASLPLHLVGIPLVVAAVVLAVVQLTQWRWDLWWRPTGLLVGGYLLQWVGHRLEGNDLGEVVLLKKWLGRPFVAVSPKYADSVGTQPRCPADGDDESDSCRGIDRGAQARPDRTPRHRGAD